MNTSLNRPHRWPIPPLPTAVIAMTAAVVAAIVWASDPRAALVAVTATLVVGSVVTSIALVPWQRPITTPADRQQALASLPPELVARGRRMRQDLRPAAIAALVVDVAVGAFFALTPAGGWAASVVGGSWLDQVLACVAAITVASTVAQLPARWYQQMVWRRYRVSHQGWGSWAAGQVGYLLLGIGLTALLLCPLYAAGGYTGSWWWVWAIALMAVVLTAFLVLVPLTIGPNSAKTSALPDGPLRERLCALADRDGMRLAHLLVQDESRRSQRANAYLAGIGPGTRVVLFDNLLKPVTESATPERFKSHPGRVWQTGGGEPVLRGASDDEIAVVFAHELAHGRYHDLLHRLVLSVLRFGVVVCGLALLDQWHWLLGRAGVESVTNPAAVGLILFAMPLLLAVLAPLAAWESRQYEIRADRHALDLTGDPEAFDSMWRRMVELNVVDPYPGRLHRLLASHPTVAERIAFGRAYTRHYQRQPELTGQPA